MATRLTHDLHQTTFADLWNLVEDLRTHGTPSDCRLELVQSVAKSACRLEDPELGCRLRHGLAEGRLMATYVEIYFASTDDREQVVRKVSSAVGVPFEPSDKPYADYTGKTQNLLLDFKVGHDLEDDAGIPFETMPYVLTVRDLLRGQLEEPAARKMFQAMEGLGYRPMYLVKGLGQILESLD
jgi:hypothetical protein